MFKGKIKNNWRSFKKNEKGTATIEAVLWFPVFVVIFGLMIDTAMIFHGQTNVLRVIQDGNRLYSIHNLKTLAETENYIKSRLADQDIAVTAKSVHISGVVTTHVTVPANQLQVLGYFTVLDSLVINVRADHMVETWES